MYVTTCLPHKLFCFSFKSTSLTFSQMLSGEFAPNVLCTTTTCRFYAVHTGLKGNQAFVLLCRAYAMQIHRCAVAATDTLMRYSYAYKELYKRHRCFPRDLTNKFKHHFCVLFIIKYTMLCAPYTVNILAALRKLYILCCWFT